MKFEWSSCAVGIVVGVGAILCVIVTVQIGFYDGAYLCAGDENALTCARDWANAGAIAAALVTIYFLAKEQSFTRELAVLQTLDVRARLATARRVARALGYNAEKIRESGFRWENPAVTRNPPINPRFMVSNILDVERLLREELWNEIADFDLELTDQKSRLAFTLTDLLRTFLGDNLDYARLHSQNFTTQMISDHWTEDVQPIEVIRLSYEIDALRKEIETLCEHLSDFRGTNYFRRRRQREGS